MHRFSIKAGLGFGLCLVLLLSSAPVLARDGISGSDSSRTGDDPSIATKKDDEINNRLDVAKERLAESKKKVCELHEKNVNRLMGNMGKVGQRHLDRMSALSDKVQAFVTKKNLTVTNYTALLADVNAKKTAAQTAVDKVKADQASFKCDGTDGRALGTTFKDDVKAQNQALKDYKKAIKSQLVAVKQTAEAQEGTQGAQQ